LEEAREAGRTTAPDIPDSIFRIACARTIRGISVVVTGRHAGGDVRARGRQIVTGRISLTTAEVCRGQIRGAGIAADAGVGIGGVAVEPAAGIDWGLASAKELERAFCEGCRCGFGGPSYAVGKV
jgi:hypothetical protein